MNTEKGSDDQMTEEQRAMLQGRLELERAEMLEEERKTAARPTNTT